MSTTVKIHVKHPDMHEEMLLSEGIIGGPMAQMMTRGNYFEEFMDLIRETDNYRIGVDYDDFPDRIRSTIDNVETLDGQLIAQIEVLEGCDHELHEWLLEHQGEEIFTISW